MLVCVCMYKPNLSQSSYRPSSKRFHFLCIACPTVYVSNIDCILMANIYIQSYLISKSSLRASSCTQFRAICFGHSLSEPLRQVEILQYTKFCIGFKIRKSRCRTTLTLRFGLLKMIFECSIARCDVGLGRAIVQCQKNPLRKPKLSINRAILSAHFSAVKFCIGFFCWIGFFLVLHRLFL